MQENSDQNNSAYGHFLHSTLFNGFQPLVRAFALLGIGPEIAKLNLPKSWKNNHSEELAALNINAEYWKKAPVKEFQFLKLFLDPK